MNNQAVTEGQEKLSNRCYPVLLYYTYYIYKTI